MIYSMTGFGKATGEVNSRKFTIEIRTLNSKSLDLNLKYPQVFREKEAEIRSLMSEYLDRGKIDLWIAQEDLGESSAYTINKELVKAYYKQLKEIHEQLGAQESDLMQVVFRLPDVVKTTEEGLKEQDWKQIKALIEKALQQTQQFRADEGKSQASTLVKHVNAISANLASVEPYESARTERLRDKLRRSTADLSMETIDQNRFEQELIYYLEKLDISEEKTRLKNHCAYFVETMNTKGYNGKKLNFIAQEMGREINTLGAKANDAQIQRLVVLMKDELEKIKEQVLNIL